jgi:peroxiredoxin
MIRLISFLAFMSLSVGGQAIELDDTAPGFTARSVDGSEVDMRQYRGKVTVLNFWRSDCDRCLEQMAMFEEIYRSYAEEGVEVVSINVDTTAEEVRSVVEEAEVSFPVLLDSSELISEAYTIGKMPYTVLVDRDGSVRYVRSGYWEADEKEYRDRVEILLRSRVAAH